MTERAEVPSTTRTRVCFGIGSSDHAANASVPPRTGRSTSPGPVHRDGDSYSPDGPDKVLPHVSHCGQPAFIARCGLQRAGPVGN